MGLGRGYLGTRTFSHTLPFPGSRMQTDTSLYFRKSPKKLTGLDATLAVPPTSLGVLFGAGGGASALAIPLVASASPMVAAAVASTEKDRRWTFFWIVIITSCQGTSTRDWYLKARSWSQ
jgi:hypothetical protein